MPPNHDHLQLPRRLRRGRMALGVNAVIIAIGIAAALFVCWLCWPIHTAIAFAPPPVPNAYDDFARAYKLEQDRFEVAFAIQPNGTQGLPAGRHYTPSERARIVRDNAAALQAIREGLRHIYVPPPVHPFDPDIEAMAEDRGLGRLLDLASYSAAEQGNWTDAARIALDGIQLGAEITRGGGITTMLSGGGIRSFIGDELEKDLAHLSARDARAAARRLEAITYSIAPFDEVMGAEKREGESGIAVMTEGANWRLKAQRYFKSTGVGVKAIDSIQHLSKQHILNHYNRYMDKLIEIYRRPYPLRKPLPPTPPDPISALFAGIGVSLASLRDAQLFTRVRLLTVELALDAYQLDHHRFPDRLQAIAPEYVTKVPVDPFTVDSPLRYHRRGAGYVLYSVGPDGKDDNGRLIPEKNPDGSHRGIDVNSRGDIGLAVAGG
ncbi:MAG TPA: hypothetical protein VFJ58_10210 [Armatimonadota bacterium]|nr:hypothetical protein [Armatimonadota bacterium]